MWMVEEDVCMLHVSGSNAGSVKQSVGARNPE
jgi:hypothetical protein